MRLLSMVMLLAVVPAWCAAQDAGTEDSPGEVSPGLHVEEVTLTLIEQRDVPAREAGVLQSVGVREGDLVTEGQPLAQIDDAEAQLDKRKAQIELEIAREKARNDVKVRLFQKAAEVAWAELRRSEESNRSFKGTVSQTELDRQRLAAEKAELEIEQARHEQTTDRLTANLKENELAVAIRAIERRQINAPLAGMVVQVNRHAGEWVEPGEPVLRLLRIDRLRVQGRIPADQASQELVGRPVVFTTDLPGRPQAEFPGKVVFVSPEVESDQQVAIWAEIDNPKLQLRPGLNGQLTVVTPVVAASTDAGRTP